MLSLAASTSIAAAGSCGGEGAAVTSRAPVRGGCQCCALPPSPGESYSVSGHRAQARQPVFHPAIPRLRWRRKLRAGKWAEVGGPKDGWGKGVTGAPTGGLSWADTAMRASARAPLAGLQPHSLQVIVASSLAHSLTMRMCPTVGGPCCLSCATTTLCLACPHPADHSGHGGVRAAARFSQGLRYVSYDTFWLFCSFLEGFSQSAAKQYDSYPGLRFWSSHNRPGQS